jgi:hypothetical protein
MNKTDKVLISLFQKAFHVGYVEPDQEKYLARYDLEIQACGRFFQYLELAKPSKVSPLGWKPTDCLLAMIKNGSKSQISARKRRQVCWADHVFLCLMFDTVFREDELQSEGAAVLCGYVLVALGLAANVPGESEQYPTDTLRQLFANAYFRAYYARQSADPNDVYEPILA